MTTPEERARKIIDAKLANSGWIVQSRDEVNMAAERTYTRMNVSQASCKTELDRARDDCVKGVLVCGARTQ